MSTEKPQTSMYIPRHIWDAYKRMRPTEPEPIHVGDKFRLTPGGPLYEIKEITYPVMKPV